MLRRYVYYRVAEARLADVVPAVRAMQAVLQSRHAGLQADLLRRPGAKNSLVTLMEVYGDAVDDTLGAAIEQAAAEHIGALIDGPRAVEVFERC